MTTEFSTEVHVVLASLLRMRQKLESGLSSTIRGQIVYEELARELLQVERDDLSQCRHKEGEDIALAEFRRFQEELHKLGVSLQQRLAK